MSLVYQQIGKKQKPKIFLTKTVKYAYNVRMRISTESSLNKQMKIIAASGKFFVILSEAQRSRKI